MAKASRLIFLSILGLASAGCTTSGVQMSEVLSVAPIETPPAPAEGPAPAEESALAESGDTAVGTLAETVAVPSERPAEAAASGTVLAAAAPAAAPESAPQAAQAATGSPIAEAKLAPTASAFAGATPSKAVEQVAFSVPQPGTTEGRSRLDRLIAHYASAYEVPEALVHRVVRRESNYRPSAYNGGNWGLMQIRYATARGMGYTGKAEGLLDAETNLRYAVRYLRGAWLVAGGDHDQAVRLYARGYYYDAKRAGLLDETGLGSDRVRKRRPG